ncbi:MAG: FliM/FliN family flagellar motor C-terminal domain-containing protein [Polyangiaceae bacterium]
MREIEPSRRAKTASLTRVAALAPYPWSSLEPLTRRDVEALRALREWARSHARLDRLGCAIEGLLAVPCRAFVRSAGPSALAPPWPEATRIVIAPQDATPAGEVALDLEAALVTALASRALRRPPPVLVKPQVVTESVAGAAAAVVGAALRRAHAGSAFAVRPTASSAPPFAPGARSADAWTATMTVVLGDEAFAARATFAWSAGGTPGPGHAPLPWTRSSLGALGATPLRLPLVATTILLSAADVATLGPGDVVVAPGWRLTRDGGTLRGVAHLAAPGDDVGVRVDLVEGGRVVLRGEREPLLGAEDGMNDEDGRGALVEAIGDVPVVVRVEVGEAVMSARDWAGLGPGDVVGLGQRVGERVLLRIGGVPVARAELVDLEGEVGVRIVARLAEETSPG